MPAGARRLAHLGVVAVSGADARRFLQGQLSCDLDQLAPQHALLGSVNSAQGRVQAVLSLLAVADDILIIVPAELVDTLIARLRPYILRSRVQLQAAGDRWQLATTDIPGALPATAAQSAPGTVCEDGAGGRRLRWWSEAARHLLLLPATPALPPDPVADLHWRAADITAGVPQVFAATSGSFVAQMLNLEVLGGISFRKGCYTGQEIIARAQYRGSVKRRLQRFAATAAPPPPPGARVLGADGAAGEVVDAVATDGGCVLLAVVSTQAPAGPLQLETGAALRRLPLPYAPPEAGGDCSAAPLQP